MAAIIMLPNMFFDNPKYCICIIPNSRPHMMIADFSVSKGDLNNSISIIPRNRISSIIGKKITKIVFSLLVPYSYFDKKETTIDPTKNKAKS
jgi:hypothetical protein